MSKIKIGETINTDLGNVLVLETNGNDAILYRDADALDKYIYAHNISFDEDKESYDWSADEYCSSLSDSMKYVIASQENTFYELVDYTQKTNYSNYVRGIVKAETEIEDELVLDNIYDSYIDSDSDSIFSDEFSEIIQKNLTMEIEGISERNLLAEKLNKEFEEYKNELKTKDEDYIIERSFETYYKDNIVLATSNTEFTDEEIEILLGKENLLDELYNDWMSFDVDEIEGYLDSINDSKDKIMQKYMSKNVDMSKEAGEEPEI